MRQVWEIRRGANRWQTDGSNNSLMLQKNNELVEVDFESLVLMRLEVAHSWTYLCHHHPCLSCLSFLFLSFGSNHTHPCSIGHHWPKRQHFSSDHRPTSRNGIHSILHLHILLRQNLLHPPCGLGLFFTISSAFSLPWLEESSSSAFSFPFLLPLPFLRLVCLPWNLL